MDSNERGDCDDFMSDVFVDQSRDVRPGIGTNRAAKRQLQIEKKRCASNAKPVKVLEKERREEGLNSPLNASNKGFQLLQKMGFKPEKHKVVEPIKLVIKEDRSCLGNDSLLDAQINAKRQKVKQIEVDFEQRMKSKYAEKMIEKDLRDSQKICHHLDIENNISAPEESWFWPLNANMTNTEVKDEVPDEIGKDLSDDESNSLTTKEKLTLITLYLRNKYFYCIWCAVKYESVVQMESECPGDTRDAHS
ncbi:Coiled-coil domain-containing protein 75-like protein [Dinothrombium tinctorium]|uniref:Coiled-coil domain-containing protein 75-like protein n=1 Tax=Dinothrombium tinctorium TaxID=1965070 RepID=A0A3S3PEN5_9ACAR|nr:Coiled-coil domain-containing protein 75-like protein [Dinothrombium tinctorium]